MRSEAEGTGPRRLSAVPTQRQDAASGPSRLGDAGTAGSAGSDGSGAEGAGASGGSGGSGGSGSGGSGTRPPVKRRTRYTARAAVLLLVFCALVLALAYPLQQYFSQSSQIDKLKRQNAQKRAQVDRLRLELERWQDPDYVRIQARNRLHYVLPGETGLRLLGSGDAASGVQNPTSTRSGGPAAWYSQVWSSVTEAATTPASPSSSPSSTPSSSSSTAPSQAPSSPTPSAPGPSSARH